MRGNMVDVVPALAQQGDLRAIDVEAYGFEAGFRERARER